VEGEEFSKMNPIMQEHIQFPLSSVAAIVPMNLAMKGDVEDY